MSQMVADTTPTKLIHGFVRAVEMIGAMMTNTIRVLVDELLEQAEYERTKDKFGTWTQEYTDGFADGLERAVEIILDKEG